MSKFTNTPPDWTVEGTEPTSELKTSGFTAGYKPPAAYFNWFWTKVSNCISELFNRTAGVVQYGENDAVTGEVFNVYEGDIANIASGTYSHAEGRTTIASGLFAHAEGNETTASGNSSHAENGHTTAGGIFAHAEGNNTSASGYASHAEGDNTHAVGVFSHAEGDNTYANGIASHAGGVGTIANAYQGVYGRYNTEVQGCQSDTDVSISSAVFVIGVGTSNTARGNVFRARADGRCCGVQAFAASGADYAEYFEWADGNKNGEDRRGLFVTLDGEKIKLANSGDYILGVVSAAPSFVGNTQSEEWHGKFKLDTFGARIVKTVEVAETTDVQGNIIPAHTEEQFELNENYDPNKEYMPRELRKEWEAIGLLGKLVVIDDGTCTVNGYCSVSADGKATKSDNGYRVISRIDSTHICILFR